MFILIGIYFAVYTASNLYYYKTYNTYLNENLEDLTQIFIYQLKVNDNLGAFLERLKTWCTQENYNIYFNLDPKTSFDYNAIDQIFKNAQETLSNTNNNPETNELITTCKNIQQEIKIKTENQSIMHSVMKCVTSPTVVISLFSIYVTLRILLGM